MTFLIVLFILMMQFLWLYIDELVGKGLGFLVIVEFLGWASATLIPMALPLATLLASIMTLGGLGENNELLAIKAAGIPLQRILAPITILAIAISIGAFFASNNLIPIAYNKIYTLRDDIGRTKDEIKIPTGVFYNGIDGYTLRVDTRDEQNGMMYDVMVYNHTSNRGNISLTVADSGMIKSTKDKSGLIFTLYSGTSYEESNKISYRDTTLSLQKITFDMQEVVIPLKNYDFKKSDEGRFGNEVMSKNLKELSIDKDSLSKKYIIVHKSHTAQIINNGRNEYYKQLDTAFKTKGLNNYVSAVPYDSLSLEEKVNVLSNAQSKTKYPVTLLENFDRESYQYIHPLRRINIETFRKFTLSLACLIFFFIGAPLGAIIRKGGLGTPVIISIFFFVVYWVVDISGKKLANDGVLSPFIGTFISTAVLLPIGIFLTIKSTKDSALFNADAYKIFLNKMQQRYKQYKNRSKNVKSN